MSVVTETKPPMAWNGVFYFRLQNRRAPQFGVAARTGFWIAYDHCHQRIGTVPFGWDANVSYRLFGVDFPPVEMVLHVLGGKTYAVPAGDVLQFHRAMEAKTWE